MGMMFDDKDVILEPELNDETAFEDVDETEGNYPQRIKALKQQLTTVEKERKEYLDGWQRAKADYLNAKKRFDEELSSSTRRAEMRFAEKLLPLVDSFSMAIDGIESNNEENAWKTGLLQIHTQLTSLLREIGVREIDALGKAFDPHLHEALQSKQVDDATKHDTVLAVLQKGYLYNDTLLRPTKVIIGTA